MTASTPKIIGNIPKLPTKYAVFIMPSFLSYLMSGMVSMINMLINIGYVDGFWLKWFSAWIISWAVAYPVVLFVLPLVRRLTAQFVDMPKG